MGAEDENRKGKRDHSAGREPSLEEFCSDEKDDGTIYQKRRFGACRPFFG